MVCTRILKESSTAVSQDSDQVWAHAVEPFSCVCPACNAESAEREKGSCLACERGGMSDDILYTLTIIKKWNKAEGRRESTQAEEWVRVEKGGTLEFVCRETFHVSHGCTSHLCSFPASHQLPMIKPQSFQDVTAVQCLESFEDLKLNKTFKLSYLISVLFISF